VCRHHSSMSQHRPQSRPPSRAASRGVSSDQPSASDSSRAGKITYNVVGLLDNYLALYHMVDEASSAASQNDFKPHRCERILSHQHLMYFDIDVYLISRSRCWLRGTSPASSIPYPYIAGSRSEVLWKARAQHDALV
jgi:hypothetical protein